MWEVDLREQYTLYLDESETHTFNPAIGGGENYHFCMAGVIAKKDDSSRLEAGIRQLKNIVWSELPNPQEIILHQMRILEAEKGRLDIKKYPEYSKFRKKEERVRFYRELKKIFVLNDITIIGSSISEAYCHFLCTKDGIGNVIYEYRELIGNEKLRDRYYHMKLMGSMYMAKATAETRLLGLDFADKNDNIAGLQLADFVPNPFARDHAGLNQSRPNIWGTLRYFRYDGGIGQPDRFGVKYMP